jgi:hypothetical protein
MAALQSNVMILHANRGSDYRTSHDIEDIIYVMDNRTTIVEEVLVDDSRVTNFLVDEFKKIRAVGMLDEVLVAHVHPIMREERIPVVKEKILRLINNT